MIIQLINQYTRRNDYLQEGVSGDAAEVADGTILPVDGFGTIKVNLDEPCNKTNPVKMVAVAYGPGLLRNLLSTREAGEQWGKSHIY